MGGLGGAGEANPGVTGGPNRANASRRQASLDMARRRFLQVRATSGDAGRRLASFGFAS